MPMINIFPIGENEFILLPKNSTWLSESEAQTADLKAIDKLFNPACLEAENIITKTASGRGLVYFFTALDENCVLRHYYRGGLVAKISNDKFIFQHIEKTRPFRELNLLAKLHAAGLMVAKPIAAKITRHGLSYSADIITGTIEHAQELHEHLMQQPLEETSWKEIGACLRKMHNLQACHFDINVKNILLQASIQSLENNDPDNVQSRSEAVINIYLLDFDGCKLRKGEHWKSANLNRFKRSLVKQKAKYSPYYYDETCWRWIEEGYCQA